MDQSLRPFHFAFQVDDLSAARRFYGSLLGCSEGRSAETWVDFDFYGHQLVCHLNPELQSQRPHVNAVDGHGVPVPHFGVVLDLPRWESLAERLRAADVKFLIEPYLRFKGEPREQATMFFLDPAGNAVEMKAFKSLDQLFAK